jgi:hypothetical protein
VSAIAATRGLYLLARAMPAIQAIAATPLPEENWAGRLARSAVDAIAFLLPRVDAPREPNGWCTTRRAPVHMPRQSPASCLTACMLVPRACSNFHRRNV